MGASVIGSGSVDKTLCLPFGSLTNAPSFSATTSYTTLYSGTGSGYLDVAIFSCQTATPAISFMRVTIDGVVVFEGQAASNSSPYYGGMINRDAAPPYYNGSVAYSNFIRTLYPQGVAVSLPSSVFAHPYTANAVIASSAPIVTNMDSFYFRSSLLIEIKAATAGAVGYFLAGGKTP